MKKRIIDKRKKEKFMMDDEYLNGQAKLCGIYATGVYMSLCRHASKNQKAFPSIKLISEELSISRDSVIKGIKSLEEHSVICIEKTRSKNGVWRNNTYILLDKSEWSKYKNQVADTDMDTPPSQVDLSVQPSRPQRPDQVADTDTKETHSEGNTFKETHTISKEIEGKAFGNEQINNLFSFFEQTMGFPSNGKKKQDRWMAQHLINNYSIDQIKAMIIYCASQEFAPNVGSIEKLWYKRGDIIAGIKKLQTNKPKILKL